MVKGREHVRKVATLFDPPPVELSAKDVEAYRARGPFAFAIDRQSSKRVLTEKERTGQEARVNAILAQARQEGLYLPEPIERPDRQEGELQYVFDRALWFVDGEERNATGFAASPIARPELWRAKLTAERLAELGCPPKVLIVGEATRFFRDEQWLTTFTRMFWSYGIRLWVCGFGEITQQNLAAYVQHVNALSAWLGNARNNARDAKRRRGQIFHGKPFFGFQFSDDKREVWTHPERWSALSDMLHRLADGRLRSGMEAVSWLRTTYEIERTPAWFYQLLRGEWLEGTYVSYTTKQQHRILEDEYGFLRDRDLTKSGYPRYLKTKEAGQRWKVQYSEGTEPISPEVLAAARARVLNRKGPPVTALPPINRVLSLLSSRIVRCAVCGSGVEETCPQQKKDGKHPNFTLFQDTMLAHLLSSGRSTDHIRKSLEAAILKETGERHPVSEHRIRHRKHRLKLTGDWEADLNRIDSYWSDPFAKRQGVWHLTCTCVSTLAHARSLTGAEANSLPEAQHVLRRNGNLSAAVWEVFWKAVVEVVPTMPAPADGDDKADIERLRHRCEKAQAELDHFTKAVLAGALGDPTDAVNTEVIARNRAPLHEAVVTARKALEVAEDQQRAKQTNAPAMLELKEQLAAIDPDTDLSLELKRSLIEAFVKKVTVNLETGEFTVETVIDYEGLRSLVGHLTSESESQPRSASLRSRVAPPETRSSRRSRARRAGSRP